MNDLLGIPEASALLGIPESTLRWYRMESRTKPTGPKSFKVGRRVRYRREDLEAWLSAQESSSARGGL